MDQLVESYVPYTLRPSISHVYVGPFIVIYAGWIYLWLNVYGMRDYWELGCIVTAGIGIVQVNACFVLLLIVALMLESTRFRRLVRTHSVTCTSSFHV